jgi:hypothetical protein
MNKIYEDINILSNHPHNNEILHQHKSFNDEEEEEYIQEKSCYIFPCKRKKWKNIEEKRHKKINKKLAFESGIKYKKI